MGDHLHRSLLEAAPRQWHSTAGSFAVVLVIPADTCEHFVGSASHPASDTLSLVVVWASALSVVFHSSAVDLAPASVDSEDRIVDPVRVAVARNHWLGHTLAVLDLDSLGWHFRRIAETLVFDLASYLDRNHRTRRIAHCSLGHIGHIAHCNLGRIARCNRDHIVLHGLDRTPAVRNSRRTALALGSAHFERELAVDHSMLVLEVHTTSLDRRPWCSRAFTCSLDGKTPTSFSSINRSLPNEWIADSCCSYAAHKMR